MVSPTISQVKIKGFRNFKNSTITLNDKSLIIGANDTGKTNLIWAIRILMDRSLSDLDIEPTDADFYAYDETDFIDIVLKFVNVTEDCVVSKQKGAISDHDELFLAYRAERDPVTNSKKYSFYSGSSENLMEEIEDRYYRKVINLEYISSRRDFHRFIGKEKRNLFQVAKENRTDTEKISDDKLLRKIKKNLDVIDTDIPSLFFVSKATSSINEELSKLSVHHDKQEIVFDTNSSNIENFVENVSISSKSGNKSIVIGGDGRLNQIYLSLWAAKNDVSEDSLKEFTIVCIEEPEALLHPHQQRKLAEYLRQSIKGQVIISSHSPQIACEYSPNSIIRLFSEDSGTEAASNGCSQIIEEAFEDFGYRMSIIPAEAFFSSVVLLVEGVSEELFYKTLS
jgi:putative ATP-dependent endonuclease of OLD family